MKKYSMFLLVFAIYALPAFAQDNLNTTRIGVWPYGWGNAVATHEDHIYLSQGRVVQIYDYANPQQPALQSEIFMDDMVTAFAFDEDKAYVAGYTGFYILDIADVTQPSIVSRFDIPTRTTAICLHSGFVYVALYDEGILVMDVSDLQNPAMVSLYQTYFINLDMVINNNVAWVATGYNGITAYDLSNPLSPIPILTYNESGSMQSATISDGLLYTINSSSGIMVFDISNLPQIQLLSSTPAVGQGMDLTIHGNLLTVTLLHQGFNLYDISEPANPDSVGSFCDVWPNRNTILVDDFVFHCSGPNFSILDLSFLQQINLTSQIGLSGTSQYVNYWNDHIYITAYEGEIMAVNVTEPIAPVKVSQVTGGDGHHTFHVKDDLLFFNNYHMLRIYDITEPSDPVFLNTLVATTTITVILKHNNLLFVGDYDNLQVFDVSDIQAPILLAVFPYEDLNELVAEGNLLYCVNHYGFFILDISDPSNLTQMSNIYNMATTGMAVKDTLAYVVSSNYPSTGETSLKVFNIKDPGSVFLITSRDHGRQFENVAIEGDYLYVYERYVGLQIYDTKEINPVLCGFFGFDRYNAKMATVNGITYLPTFAGIDIVQNDLLTSVENIFIEREDRLNLFPNPSGNFISFELEDNQHSGTFSYEIIQLNGTGIKLGKLISGQQQISLDGLPAGVYVLQILKAGQKFKSGMFVKQ